MKLKTSEPQGKPLIGWWRRLKELNLVTAVTTDFW
jgi:hypothetical protein